MGTETPSTTGAIGRDSSGRFAPGNSLARGNPYARRVAKLRSAMLDAVSEEDMRDVIGAMLSKAKEGDTAAARILLDRCLGPSEASDVLERVEQLEQLVKGTS